MKSTSTDQKTKKKSSKKPDSKKADVKKSKKASTIKGKMEEETNAEAAPAVEAETKGIFKIKEVKIVYRLFLVNCYLNCLGLFLSQLALVGG